MASKAKIHQIIEDVLSDCEELDDFEIDHIESNQGFPQVKTVFLTNGTKAVVNWKIPLLMYLDRSEEK